MSAFIVVVLVLVASPFCVFMSFNEEIDCLFLCVLCCCVLLLCVVVGCAIQNEKMKKKSRIEKW